MGMRARAFVMAAALAVVLAASAMAGEDIPWGEEKAAPSYPMIFRGRAAERLAAEEVARQDAYRKLVERIYGLPLDASTDVHDLALLSREIDTELREQVLKGMRNVATKYYDDGRVESAVKVTMREVVEIIEETIRRTERGGDLVSEETLRDVRRENRDKEILAVGRGALPGSEGLKKVRAMRAAEVDCYERIAARVFGMKISGETSVRDFALTNDRIRSKVSVALLNGVKFTDYTFLDDATSEATARLTIREVVEVLTRIHRRYGEGTGVRIEDIENLEVKNRDLVIVETGHGVPAEAEPAVASFEPFSEQKTVVERVLSREIVVE